MAKNKYEIRAEAYERKNMPQKPNKKNLDKLTTLANKLKVIQDEHKELTSKIDALKLPNIIVSFAKQHPDLTITSTTDQLCSVMCASDNIKTMPQGASDIHIEGDKISFKVLLD